MSWLFGKKKVMSSSTSPVSEAAQAITNQEDGDMAILQKLGTKARLRRHFSAEINKNHTDILMLVCCLISGLVDSTIYNGRFKRYFERTFLIELLQPMDILFRCKLVRAIFLLQPLLQFVTYPLLRQYNIRGPGQLHQQVDNDTIWMGQVPYFHYLLHAWRLILLTLLPLFAPFASWHSFSILPSSSSDHHHINDHHSVWCC